MGASATVATGLPPLPPGAVLNSQPASGSALPPLPPGATLNQTPAAPASAPTAPKPGIVQRVGETDPTGQVNFTKGVVKGGMHRVAGLMNLLNGDEASYDPAAADAYRKANPQATAEQALEATMRPADPQGHIHLVKRAADWLNAHSQDHGFWQHAGDFGESAAELMTPEALGALGEAPEAMKAGEAANAADKYAKAAEAAKVLQKFPRIRALVTMGLAAAARGAAEVGGQTLVTTGGDTQAATKAALMGAAVGGVGTPVLGATSMAAAAGAARLGLPEKITELLSTLDKSLESYGPAVDKETAGKAVRGTIDEIQDAAKAEANAVYNPLKKPLGLKPDATREELLEASMKAQQPSATGVLDASGKPVMKPGDGGKALDDFRKADARYVASRADVERELVQKIAKSDTPELAGDYLAKASLDDLRAVMPKLSAATRNAVARNAMQDVLDRAGYGEKFSAQRGLAQLRRLDRNGAKSDLLFGKQQAADLRGNLKALAEATKTNAGREAVGYGIRRVAEWLVRYGGYKAGEKMTGSWIGGVGGAAAAEEMMMMTRRVYQSVMKDPKAAQNLLYAIEYGARPELYAPMVGALIQQNETEQSNAAKKAEGQQ